MKKKEEESEKPDFSFTERFYKDYESYFHKRPNVEKLSYRDLEDGLHPEETKEVIDPPLRDGAESYVHDYFPGFVFVVIYDDIKGECVVITMRPRIMKLKNPELIDAPNKKERRQIERHQTHLETMNAMIAEMKELRKEMLAMMQTSSQSVNY